MNVQTTLEVAKRILGNSAREIRDHAGLFAGISVVSAAAGALVGIKATKVRLYGTFNRVVEEEVYETRRYYTSQLKMYKDAVTELRDRVAELEQEEPKVIPTPVFKTPQEATSKLIPVLKDVQDVTRTYSGDTGEEPVVMRNVFVDGVALEPSDFDYDTEVSQRSEDFPYVITEEEFFENEWDFVQWTCTYYAGDDVLVDEAENVIDDSDAAVGDDNLKRFGHGSNNASIVYVRNNKRGLDFEIARSTGTYVHEVLGMSNDEEDEIRHSARRRFRGDDD